MGSVGALFISNLMHVDKTIFFFLLIPSLLLVLDLCSSALESMIKCFYLKISTSFSYLSGSSPEWCGDSFGKQATTALI